MGCNNLEGHFDHHFYEICDMFPSMHSMVPDTCFETNFRLIYKYIKRVKNFKDVDTFRRHAKPFGVKLDPFGIGNGKTATGSTYRPIEETCPTTCEFRDNGCLAQLYRVNAVQKRSSSNALRQAFTASAAALVSINLEKKYKDTLGIKGRKYKNRARMHVSGDFLKHGSIDIEYIIYLCFIGIVIQSIKDVEVVGFGYSHCGDDIKPYLHPLKMCGFHFRLSGDVSSVGAVTIPSFEYLPMIKASLKEEGIKAIGCPEQLYPEKDITCATCHLCYKTDNVDRLIIFQAHGNHLNYSMIQESSIIHLNKFGLFN